MSDLRARWRRLLAGLLAGACALASSPVAAATWAYSDVPPGSYGAAAIADLSQRGIMRGVGNGMFMPSRPMTRAQMAALLSRAEGWPQDGIGPAFRDVASGDWYFGAVEAAASHEAMGGLGGGRFDPNGTETQADAVVSVVRVLGLQHVADDDAPAGGGWASGAYAVGSDLGLIPQPSDPGGALTRAAAAILVDAMLHVSPAQLRQVGGADAAYVDITPAGEVNAGATIQMHAYAHDSTGYIVPADFRWSAAGGTITAGGLLTAGTSGDVTVTAHVPGGPSATVALAIHTPVALAFAPLSTLVSAGTAQTVTVDVVGEQGGIDPADSGRSIRLTAGGGTWTATDQQGQARFTIQLPPGTSDLTATAAGLAAASQAVTATASTYALVLSAPQARLQAGQREPLAASVVDGNGNVVPGTFAIAIRADGGDTVALAPARITGASADAGTLQAPSPGQVTITASVAGGAVAAGTLTVQVVPAGTLTVTVPSQVTAGGTGTVTVSGDVPDGTRLTVTPTDPDGNHPPSYTATFHGGSASIRMRPTLAGAWHLRALAAGDLGTATLDVVPGPATQVVVHPLPTSILLPGQRSRLYVAEGDAYGNPISAPVHARLTLAGAGALSRGGVVDLSGPGVAAAYNAASSPGTATVTVTVAGLPPAAVMLRTVPDEAAVAAGKGMWLIFPDWRTEGTAAIIRAARAAGVTHIYLEVATSSDGFYGARALDSLLWQAHDAGIAVISWVYAALWQPAQDISMTRAVAAYTGPLGDAADGLAADIEENMAPATVGAYAALARQALGSRPLVGVTYPPQQMPDYPYAALAPYVTVWAPMDYWHTTERDFTYHAVYTWVAASLAGIDAAAGTSAIPFDVIAQTFDWFADSGTGIFSPTPDEVEAAMAAAAAGGAEGVSFYRWTTATPQEWAVAVATYAP